MRNMPMGRTWTALLVVAVLALAAGSVSAALSSNAPDWWDNPDPGSANLRAQWYDWEGDWVPNKGISPDEITLDFEVNPWNTQLTQWYGIATNEDNVSSDWGNGHKGIQIPPSQSAWEVDISLANAMAKPWKFWYLEFTLTGNDADIEKIIGKSLVSELAAKTADNVEIPVQELRQGWDSDTNTWYAEYFIDPQPDWEKWGMTFSSNGTDPTSDTVYVSEFYTGTMCTPEPASAFLLVLGLPLAVLVRRRRDKT